MTSSGRRGEARRQANGPGRRRLIAWVFAAGRAGFCWACGLPTARLFPFARKEGIGWPFRR